MDERRTLAILAWALGSVVGTMFILNGIALSFESTPAPASKHIATGNVPAPHPTAIPVAQGG